MFRQSTFEGVRRRGLLAAIVALVAFAAVPLGGAPEPAYAGPPEDAVLDWNLHATNALVNAPTAATNKGAGQTPPVSLPHLAMVQGAVYDAVNMIDGGHHPYLAGLPAAPASASKAAAVATAAHDVLAGIIAGLPLTPTLTQAVKDEIVGRLLSLRNESIAAAIIQDGAAVPAGIAAGAAAANAMLDERANDGRYGSLSFPVGTDPGEWRPTPPGFVNDPFAWVARVDPFLIESWSQFRSKGPHKLKSGIYAKEYNEVKQLGGNSTPMTPTLRTPDQTELALFYTVNPVELFNRTFRGISAARGLTLVEEARLSRC